MGFSRQAYWSGLPFVPPGDHPNPGINPHLLCPLSWQAILYCATWEGLCVSAFVFFIACILVCNYFLNLPVCLEDFLFVSSPKRIKYKCKTPRLNSSSNLVGVDDIRFNLPYKTEQQQNGYKTVFMCWTVTNAGQSEEKHMGGKLPIHTSFLLEGVFQMVMQRNSFAGLREKIRVHCCWDYWDWRCRESREQQRRNLKDLCKNSPLVSGELWAIMMRTNYVLCRHKIYWSLSTSWYLSNITESRILKRHVYIHIQCSVMHKSQEVEARQMLSIDEWITKTWSIHTMKCWSAFKGKEILTCTAAWMNLENIKLSEII